jgi:hypothetical protein
VNPNNWKTKGEIGKTRKTGSNRLAKLEKISKTNEGKQAETAPITLKNIEIESSKTVVITSQLVKIDERKHLKKHDQSKLVRERKQRTNVAMGATR